MECYTAGWHPRAPWTCCAHTHTHLHTHTHTHMRALLKAELLQLGQARQGGDQGVWRMDANISEAQRP